MILNCRILTTQPVSAHGCLSHPHGPAPSVLVCVWVCLWKCPLAGLSPHLKLPGRGCAVYVRKQITKNRVAAHKKHKQLTSLSNATEVV